MSANLSVVPELRIYRPASNTVPENSAIFREIEAIVRYTLRSHGYPSDVQSDLEFLETPRVHLLPEDEYNVLHRQRGYRRLGTHAVAKTVDLELDKRMPLRYTPLPVELKKVQYNYRPNYIEVGYELTSSELYIEEEICVNALREITHSTTRPKHIPKPFLEFARLQYRSEQKVGLIVKRAAEPASTDPRLMASLDVVYIDDLSYEYPD